jgi:hypothetical protein
VALRERDERLERIERTRVDLPGLQNDDRRNLRLGLQPFPQAVGQQAPGGIDRNVDEPCRAELATRRIGGAPERPLCSTSQPRAARSAWRAAARQVTCAIWQPVTNAKPALAGMPRSSFSQPPATSSATAAAGAQA